jgi:hypothetical protein
MSESFEFALSGAKSGWVMLLGDDDGLVPDAVAVLEEAIRANPGIKVFDWPLATFHWPDHVDPCSGKCPFLSVAGL